MTEPKPPSLSAMMTAYNELADQAAALGLAGFPRLGGGAPPGKAWFTSRERGDRALARITAAIAEAALAPKPQRRDRRPPPPPPRARASRRSRAAPPAESAAEPGSGTAS